MRIFLSLSFFCRLSLSFRTAAIARAILREQHQQQRGVREEEDEEEEEEEEDEEEEERLRVIMDIDFFFRKVLKRSLPDDPRVADYDLDSLEASGRIMLLKRADPEPDLVLIAQLLLERVVPVFLCHDPSDVLIHQAGWILETTVERRFPDVPHATYLLDFLQELGLCRTTLVGNPPQRASFFPTLVQEDEGWWGDTTSHNWQWYCGVRVQVPDDKGHKLPPSLLCRLIVALQERFEEFEVRVSKRAGVSFCNPFFLPSTFLADGLLSQSTSVAHTWEAVAWRSAWCATTWTSSGVTCASLMWRSAGSAARMGRRSGCRRESCATRFCWSWRASIGSGLASSLWRLSSWESSTRAVVHGLWHRLCALFFHFVCNFWVCKKALRNHGCTCLCRCRETSGLMTLETESD